MAARAGPAQVPRRKLRPPPGVLALGVTGAILIALNAAWLLFLGGTLPSWLSSGASLVWLGGVGLVEAALLAGAAVYAYLEPRHHTALGVAMITFALLALQIGGGALLGTLLGYVGGVVAIAHRPAAGADSLETVDLDAVRRDPVLEADLIRSGYLLTDAPAGPGETGAGPPRSVSPGVPPGPEP